MNKLKKIIKKYKKLSEKHDDIVMVLEEKGGNLSVVINGDEGIEYSDTLDVDVLEKLKTLLDRNSIEYYVPQKV